MVLYLKAQNSQSAPVTQDHVDRGILSHGKGCVIIECMPAERAVPENYALRYRREVPCKEVAKAAAQEQKITLCVA